jgi:chloramphenicol O-acetyltransferase type B
VGKSSYQNQRSFTQDVAPYAIVGGNPAKEIRKRFPDAHIAMLLEMQWWDWPLEAIKAAMPLLCAGDIEGLFRHWRAAGSGQH